MRIQSSGDIKIPIGFHSLWVDLRTEEEKSEDPEESEDSSSLSNILSLLAALFITL